MHACTHVRAHTHPLEEEKPFYVFFKDDSVLLPMEIYYFFLVAKQPILVSDITSNLCLVTDRKGKNSGKTHPPNRQCIQYREWPRGTHSNFNSQIQPHLPLTWGFFLRSEYSSPQLHIRRHLFNSALFANHFTLNNHLHFIQFTN